MKLTYKFKINYNEDISNLCKISKNLYNQANYLIRQDFIKNRKYLNYNIIENILKNQRYEKEDYDNYHKLKIQTSQQILLLLDKNWKSFFKSIKDYSKNKSKYLGKPNLPKYLKKVEYILIYTNQNCQIKKNILVLSKNIKIKIPEYKDFSNFNQVRILPFKKYYEVEIIYEQNIVNSDLDLNNYTSIDLGLNNLITLISENKSILFSGKIIKSINQMFNKKYSKLKSIKDKKKGINLNYNKLRRLECDRKYFIKDYFHKVSRSIINYCLINKIGNLVVGYNVNWKTSINIGKRNNQNFVQIPYSQLLTYLEYKCNLVGIKFIKTEESYTSKCDGLALEKICKHENYLGKRIKRGLFQSSIGRLINADVNGALNILRKVIDDSSEFIQKIINSRVLFNPVKIRTTEMLLNFCKGIY